ncbi:(deoxy)nucleoside triphosphate pyrophosphohydrolase [Chlorobium sp. N1]|uniref:(deoxy)nucleoside triphosphate pyrophosphohydrolase n=1 Tax=Chlorobium sp. N1 TaxID=2491138 RepID=UPI001038A503|nr:(deoxy)nucleoside triphosphate pyrophosphohydrolase [Chlorobium sp. N1]TCD48789.1 (deoxy)nucleoside triphosphate pyrophosphohydrolase [Chlorobium sp. N1]
MRAPARHIGEVVCAIVERDGRFLIARRPEGRPLGGLWEFPGGKVEPGETPRQALHRELMEEMRIRVEILAPLTPVEHAYPDFSLRLVPFRCSLVSGEPVLAEHDDLAWISCDMLSSYRFPEADLPVLEEYLRLVGA